MLPMFDDMLFQLEITELIQLKYIYYKYKNHNFCRADNYIALVETGKRFPSVKMLEQIAKALEKDTLELFSPKQDNLSKNRALKTNILADIDAILSIRLNETEN